MIDETKRLLNEGLSEETIESLNLYLSNIPNDADAYYWRSVAKNKLQDRSSAMNDLLKALELNPEHKQASAALELNHRIMAFYSKDLLNP